jgi:hypothetical protein
MLPFFDLAVEDPLNPFDTGNAYTGRRRMDSCAGIQL